MSLSDKLLALALCPSSPQGEWEAAAIKYIGTLRKIGTRIEDLHPSQSGSFTTWSNQATQQEAREEARQAAERKARADAIRKAHFERQLHLAKHPEDNELGWGKYKGKTIKWIVRNDPKWTDWLISSSRSYSRVWKRMFDNERTRQRTPKQAEMF